MNKLLLSLLTFFVLAGSLTAPGYAFDTSSDTQKSKKFQQEMGQSQKETLDKGSTTEVSLSLETLFLPKLLQLEKIDTMFKKCSIISKPKLLKHFGLSAEISPGVYDTIFASALKTAADSNSSVSEFTDEKKIREYRNCLAMYGSVIGQAFLNLRDELKDIPNLDKEDMETLTDMAVEKVVDGFNPNIKSLYQSVISDKEPCNFSNSSSVIQCGNSTISITSKPTLTIGDTTLYGSKYFGYAGSFKVSNSSKATKEIVKTRKKSFDKSKSGKQTVSLSQFLNPLQPK